MTGEIITVGNEILSGRTLDTNLAFLGRELEANGLPATYHQTVGDHVDDIVAAIQLALGRVRVVIVTGGLGPTPDDVTRKAVGQALGRPLALDHAVLERIRERWRSLGGKQEMPANNDIQALVPRGARVLDNPVGSAPGLQLEHEGKTVFVLPGVPMEMRAIARDAILPWIRRQEAHPVEYLTFRTTGIRESVLAHRLADLHDRLHDCRIAYLPSFGSVDVRIRLPLGESVRTEAARDLARREIHERLGDYVYAEGETTLQAAVGALLVERGEGLATAESCTGGLLAARLTSTPGSSAYFERGFVCYSNRSKEELVGVPHDLIVEHGAVSEPVSRALAAGAATRAHVAVGVGITGIAGPDGGTDEKPVGTVHVAVHRSGHDSHRHLRLSGDRDLIRDRTVSIALDMVRRALLGLGD